MSWSNRAYQCPYYKWNEYRCVHCEGATISFPDRAAQAEFVTRFCAHERGWRHCSLASMLSRYYERTDGL